ncbi:CAP domain-containing protein [Massilia oculi]|uniref:CAP domain-containing protein n=1 Tax=Massilia oculi TaxID=945844 RepID=UPI002696609D|nr:CAP domain-containing protein [Massilia oculi]
MSYTPRWQSIAAILGAALALSACGDGGGDSPAPQAGGGMAVAPSPAAPAPAPAPAVGAPALTGSIALDGRNWINYRRAQAGVPTVTPNAQIDNAALGHSEYLRINNLMSHDQEPGRQGFTGATLGDRLNAAGYTLDRARGFAYGEVISGSSNGSGFFMTEELITAIYHRFVIFEPMFREIGTGAASASRGYHYFTADFASRNGYGPASQAARSSPGPSAARPASRPTSSAIPRNRTRSRTATRWGIRSACTPISIRRWRSAASRCARAAAPTCRCCASIRSGT